MAKKKIKPVDKELEEKKVYSFAEAQANLSEYFKHEMKARINAEIVNLIGYLRSLEAKTNGAGVNELDSMLSDGVISEQMHQNILPTLFNLEAEYKVSLNNKQN